MIRFPRAATISAVALALLGTTAARAETAEVRYADLNLASPAGKAELERRVAVAARRACRIEAPAATRIADRTEVERCKAEVRAQVAAALHQ